MYRLAEMQKSNGDLWGCIAAPACLASRSALPGLPNIRIALAGAVVFGCMFVGNIITKQK